MIHQEDKLRLGPLGLQGADSENDTKSIEHFQTQRRPKEYNQSGTTSNMIRTTPRGITVTTPVALTQGPETQAKLDVQEVDIGR